MRAILTGGGTGGHIYPAIAIAKALLKNFPGAEILYVGTEKGLESKIVPQEGLKFRAVTAEGFDRHSPVQSLRAVAKLAYGMGQAMKIVRDFAPQVVIATGGYVSVPVAYAGSRAGIPLILHEQNVIPGRANLFLARRARAVCLTFEESASYFRRGPEVVVTGLPVRPEILAAERDLSRKTLGIDPQKFVILAIGGSRGARRINTAVAGIATVLGRDPRVFIAWSTGEAGYEEACRMLGKETGHIRVMPYIYDMASYLAAADLVIGRAGATFLAEILARGLPSILVPYPYATQGHQEKNARLVAKKGAAVVITDSELTAGRLGRTIEELLLNRTELQDMAQAARKLGRPEAAENIISVIASAISGGRSQGD